MSNAINIVLLERCWHPLTGAFPDRHQLDDPLDESQLQMLRTAVDRMLNFVSDDARDIVSAMFSKRHPVRPIMNAGEARRVSQLIEILWEKTPEDERKRLSEWFRCFNSNPSRRWELDTVDASASCALAP